MVGVGLVMLALVMVGLWLRLRRRLYDTGWFLWALTWSASLGFIAVIAGWTTTEVGRQPWTVYGVMRTAHSVTPSISGADVLLSLLGYIVVYLIMFPTGLWFVTRIIRGGVSSPEETTPVEAGRPAHPVKPVPETTSRGAP
jgi:cytochrome d ubiquinol oxidase subunit I